MEVHGSKSLEICPAIFQTWKKSGKWSKVLIFFFQIKPLKFFPFGQILFNLTHMFAVHHEKSFKTESTRKLRNLKFQSTKTLYQNNLEHSFFHFSRAKDVISHL